MELEILVLHLKRIIIGIMLFFWIGCAPRVVFRPTPAPQRPAPSTETDKPMEIPEEAQIPGAKKPQELASIELIDQARGLIDADRPDDAIRILERAVNLHPQNGETYYYLAEAWLKKGNVPQAKEFHLLAGIYLGMDHKWSSKLKRQEIKIKNF
jgi:tetratricopeptide (TPR) repeat protein